MAADEERGTSGILLGGESGEVSTDSAKKHSGVMQAFGRFNQFMVLV
jgi:hypothetical protein